MRRYSFLAAAVLALALASCCRAARLDEALQGAFQAPQQCAPGE